MKLEPKKIIIYLTNHCNLNCRHCFLSASPQKHQKLSWPQIKSVLDYFSQHRIHEVSFSGGEAILSPHVRKAVKYARKLGYKKISIYTNGLSQEIFRQFTPLDIDQIIYSLDGASPDTHDLIRGEGNFNRSVTSITKAISLHFNTSANVCVNHHNYQEITKTISFLDNLGVSRISISHTTPRGNARTNQDLLISPRLWQKLYRKISQIKNLKHATIRIAPQFIDKNKYQQQKSKLKQLCFLNQPRVFEIHPDGFIYPCCLLSDYPEYACGQATSPSLNLNDPKKNKLLDPYRQDYCAALQFILTDSPILSSQTKLIPVCLYYKDLIENQNPPKVV